MKLTLSVTQGNIYKALAAFRPGTANKNPRRQKYFWGYFGCLQKTSSQKYEKVRLALRQADFFFGNSS
jgi:hypothetical protein